MEKNNFESLEYLEEIKTNHFLDNKQLVDILEKVGYILTDNGHSNARWLLDDIIELLED